MKPYQAAAGRLRGAIAGAAAGPEWPSPGSTIFNGRDRAVFAIGKPFPAKFGVGWLAKGDRMGRLNVNFREPEPQSRRSRLAALGHAIVRGIVMGALGSVALHVVGVLP